MEMWSIMMSPALPSRRRAGFHQLINDGIHQRLERRIDDVGGDADRGPAIAGFVGAFDQDAGDGLRAAVEDTHALDGEFEPGDEALIFTELLAQRQVERIDRTDAFGDRDEMLVADSQLHHRLADGKGYS